MHCDIGMTDELRLPHGACRLIENRSEDKDHHLALYLLPAQAPAALTDKQCSHSVAEKPKQPELIAKAEQSLNIL